MKGIAGNLRARAAVLALLAASPCGLAACGESNLPQVPEGLDDIPVYQPKAPETAAPPTAEPAAPVPREVALSEGRVTQLLQYAAGVPTREAVATWTRGSDALRVFTRHRDKVMEAPQERMGIASVHETVQVIVAHGAHESVVLEKTVANMMALADQVTFAVFAALEADALRIALDMTPPDGVVRPDPTNSLRARVTLEEGRVVVSDRWEGKLTELPEAQELPRARGAPWPKAAVALSVDGDALVWWDATWSALHRQPAPHGARLLPTDEGVVVATPSEVWRIDRARDTALRKRVPLPSVEPSLRQSEFHENRAVVTQLDQREGVLCVEVSEYEYPADQQARATYAIDARSVARGWLSASTYDERVDEPPCTFPIPSYDFFDFDRTSCVATFKDGGPNVTTPRKGKECNGVDGVSRDRSIVAVSVPAQATRGSDVRHALMDRASGALVVQRPESHVSLAPFELAPGLNAALSEGWVLDARAGGVVKRLGASAVWLKD